MGSEAALDAAILTPSSSRLTNGSSWLLPAVGLALPGLLDAVLLLGRVAVFRSQKCWHRLLKSLPLLSSILHLLSMTLCGPCVGLVLLLVPSMSS